MENHKTGLFRRWNTPEAVSFLFEHVLRELERAGLFKVPEIEKKLILAREFRDVSFRGGATGKYSKVSVLFCYLG